VPNDSYCDMPNTIRGSNCSSNKSQIIRGHGEQFLVFLMCEVLGGTCNAVFVVVCDVTVDTLTEVL
jgi:hypothetical protein